MSDDASLPMRIFKALDSLDVTLCLSRARGTKFLRFPCDSSAALGICWDKHREHELSSDPAVWVMKERNTESKTHINAKIPAVVEPSGGTISEGSSSEQC